MKRLLSVVLAISMLLTLAFALPVSADATNLIVNGTFDADEIGTVPEGWVIGNSTAQVEALDNKTNAIATAEHPLGSKIVHFGNMGMINQENIPFINPDNANWSLKFDAYIEGGSGQTYIVTAQNDGSDDVIYTWHTTTNAALVSASNGSEETFFASVFAWNKIELPLDDVISEDTVALTVMLEGGNSGGCVDNVVLSESQAPVYESKQFVVDPGFENYGTDSDEISAPEAGYPGAITGSGYIPYLAKGGVNGVPAAKTGDRVMKCATGVRAAFDVDISSNPNGGAKGLVLECDVYRSDAHFGIWIELVSGTRDGYSNDNAKALYHTMDAYNKTNILPTTVGAWTHLTLDLDELLNARAFYGSASVATIVFETGVAPLYVDNMTLTSKLPEFVTTTVPGESTDFVADPGFENYGTDSNEVSAVAAGYPGAITAWGHVPVLAQGGVNGAPAAKDGSRLMRCNTGEHAAFDIGVTGNSNGGVRGLILECDVYRSEAPFGIWIELVAGPDRDRFSSGNDNAIYHSNVTPTASGEWTHISIDLDTALASRAYYKNATVATIVFATGYDKLYVDNMSLKTKQINEIKPYTSLEDAVNDIDTAENVTLTLKQNTRMYNVPEFAGKNITIDLDGNTLYTAGKLVLPESAKLTVENGNISGGIKADGGELTSDANYIGRKNIDIASGTVSITGGNFANAKLAKQSAYFENGGYSVLKNNGTAWDYDNDILTSGVNLAFDIVPFAVSVQPSASNKTVVLNYGDDATYQWQKQDDDLWIDLDGETSAALNAKLAGTYRCTGLYADGETEFTTDSFEIVIKNGQSLTLKDVVGANYYLDANAYLDDVDGAYVELTYDRGQSKVDETETDTIYLSSIAAESDGTYVFSASMVPALLTSEINIALFDADDNKVFEDTYTMAGYCKKALEQSADEDLKNLAKALLVFGTNCQITFDKDADNLAIDKEVADEFISTYDASGIGDAYVSEGATGLTLSGVSLEMLKNTCIHHFVELADGYDVSDYDVTLDTTGAFGNTSMDAKLIKVTQGEYDYYYVNVTGIEAPNLSVKYTLTIKNKADSTETVINYSALNYVKTAHNTPSCDAETLNLCKAIGLYSNYANAYFRK